MFWKRVDKTARWYERLTGLILGTVSLVGLGVGLVLWLRHHQVPAWVPVAVGVPLLIAASFMYEVGRWATPRPSDEEAIRAVQELEIARAYLSHVFNFMSELRVSAFGIGAALAITKLEALRELVFDAIIQGINTTPGEHIRCALFEPVEEGGETVLVVRRHRGHTHRVERLRLKMSSVAGIAYTTRHEIYVPNAQADPRVETTIAGRPVETLYCLPSYTFRSTHDREKPVGVFSVASNKPNAFSQSDRIFISACAEILGLIEFFVGIFETLTATTLGQAATGVAAPQTVPAGPPSPPGIAPPSPQPQIEAGEPERVENPAPGRPPSEG